MHIHIPRAHEPTTQPSRARTAHSTDSGKSHENHGKPSRTRGQSQVELMMTRPRTRRPSRSGFASSLTEHDDGQQQQLPTLTRSMQRSLPAAGLRFSFCSPSLPALRIRIARNLLVTSAANLPFASSSSSRGAKRCPMGHGWRARFQYRHLVMPLHRDEAGNQRPYWAAGDIEAASPNSRSIPRLFLTAPLFCPGSRPAPVPARVAIRRHGTRPRWWSKGGGMCCACMLWASRVAVASPLRAVICHQSSLFAPSI